MLVECSNCGAPLSLGGSERFVKCAYCDSTNKVRSLKTLAVHTPAHWKPPEKWAPPPSTQAGGVRASKAPSVLVYHGPRIAPVPQVQVKRNVGCILFFSLLMVLVTGIVPFFFLFQSSSRSTLPSFLSSAPRTIDTTALPTRGFVSLDPGQPSITHTAMVTASLEASRVATGCHGNIPVAADLGIRLSQPRHIRITASSTQDLTLLVREPSGTIRCDDDSGGSRNPLVSAVLPAGESRVWVGVYSRGTSAMYTLTAEAFDSADPSAPLAPSAALDPNQPAALGVLDMQAHPSGMVMRATIIPQVNVQPLGPSCRGIVPVAPHLVVQLSRPQTLRVTTSGDGDLTLVVRAPDGTFRCDDDSGGRSQPLLTGEMMPGMHHVWVGVYTQTQPRAFTLRVEPAVATRRSRHR